jgi:hypothetical protein
MSTGLPGREPSAIVGGRHYPIATGEAEVLELGEVAGEWDAVMYEPDSGRDDAWLMSTVSHTVGGQR